MTPEERFNQIEQALVQTAELQRKQAAVLLTHAKAIAEHDERLERIGRHLEVLINILDDLIRKGPK